MNKKDGSLSTLILVIIFFVGACLLAYPSVADYWNSFHQSRAIANYEQTIANMDDTTYLKYFQEADDYNASLALRPYSLVLDDAEKAAYNDVLNPTGSGVMGYIDIPVIKVSLPIYHGTSEGVLQVAIGHLEGTSLPVGGESTHCVMSGHRGLPSAKLFTDIDKLVEGDQFMLRVLGETLTYEIDQILIVLPAEVEALKIEEGKDLCTLVTCTPYGINTHRMLVRGHRVETLEVNKVRVTPDAFKIDPIMVAPAVAAPILITLLAILIIKTSRRRR